MKVIKLYSTPFVIVAVPPELQASTLLSSILREGKSLCVSLVDGRMTVAYPTDTNMSANVAPDMSSDIVWVNYKGKAMLRIKPQPFLLKSSWIRRYEARMLLDMTDGKIVIQKPETLYCVCPLVSALPQNSVVPWFDLEEAQMRSLVLVNITKYCGIAISKDSSEPNTKDTLVVTKNMSSFVVNNLLDDFVNN